MNSEDKVLANIFSSDDTAGQAIASPDTLDGIGQDISTIAKGLNVVVVNARQDEEIAGNGETGQRQKSQGYQRLLVRRPQLGQKLGVTPERFQGVIEKDAAYDSLTVVVKESRQRVAFGITSAGAVISGKVQTVLSFVGAALNDDESPPPPGMRNAFLFVGTDLAEKQAQKAGQAQHAESTKKPLKQQLTAAQQKKALVPQVDRLTRDAQQGAAPQMKAKAEKA